MRNLPCPLWCCLLTSSCLTPPTGALACYLSLPYFAFTQQADKAGKAGKQGRHQAGRQMNKKIGGWMCGLMNGESNFYSYYSHCLLERKWNNKSKFSQCLINHHVKKEYGECGYSCIHPPGVIFFLSLCSHFIFSGKRKMRLLQSLEMSDRKHPVIQHYNPEEQSQLQWGLKTHILTLCRH